MRLVWELHVMHVVCQVLGADHRAIHQLARVALGESHDFRNFPMARLALRPILYIPRSSWNPSKPKLPRNQNPRSSSQMAEK